MAKEVKKEVKEVKKAPEKKEVKKESAKEVAKKEIKKEVPKVEQKETKIVKEPKKEQETKEAVKKVEVKTTAPKKESKKKQKSKFLLVKSKRKTAIAMGKIEDGNGRITVNKIPLDVVNNKYLNYLLNEPVVIAQNYKPELVKKVNISVKVTGGGVVGQTVAARGCIAKGLVEFFDDKNLKELYMKYDKTLLVDDARRKEAKKQLGMGARAKKQHSKR